MQICCGLKFAVDGDDALSDDGSVFEPRLVRAGGLFAGRVGTAPNQDRRARERARELAELYASMKAMRYGRR